MNAGRPVRALKALVSVVVVLVAVPSSTTAAEPEHRSVRLDGHGLTLTEVVAIARDDVRVTVPAAAMTRVERSFQLLLEGARQDQAIYGLTRGVGENKDKTIFKGGQLDSQARRLSEEFNANLLRIQSTAVGPPAPDKIVRGAMAIRLNAMLIGHTGVQRQVVEGLRNFLNRGITPVVPGRGTVGEADIDILAHIGLALMGEGKASYRGSVTTAARALRAAGLEPIVPFGKDALSIFSSNAYSAAIGVFAATDTAHMLDVSRRVFALSLEGLNGNVAPFLDRVQRVRSFPHQRRAAADVRHEIAGSYLWSPSPQRALQDPLSYRTFAHVLGSAESSLDEVQRQLRVQINRSDDNPTVVPGAAPPPNATAQERSYYVNGNGISGAIFPTANFEPLSWVVRLESLAIALSHVSATSLQRTLRLATPEFTHLSRFLTAGPHSIGYAAIQKIPADLDARNRDLANPVSIDAIPVAGDIEDTATNAAAAGQRVDKITDNLLYILAVELMHAAQAVNLRQRENPQLALGRATRPLLADYRKRVAFLDNDRVLSIDVKRSYDFLHELP